ncbi:unnamed protein product [Bursaphelenchus xylophilus]|uniref:(pine wood nematode) hypothetical protein n=1 Tax=Bursaphelenchus xylophilus TaxID=6326 RepID=A0A1I7RJ12_BURXY|nr:unnamed protein product [Bursaphelenchus xylophilus]CAG9119241.1 unnamed protein product [Bursaphelenchus xylophilus]
MQLLIIFVIFALCSADEVPKKFDLRDHAGCGSRIKQVQSQSLCLNSWAIQAASVLSDRLCMMTTNADVEVSGMDILACCKGCMAGCYDYSATVRRAFLHWTYRGVKTYLKNQTKCFPDYPECKAFNDDTVTLPWHPCKGGYWGSLPTCKEKCDFEPIESGVIRGSELVEIKGNIDLIKQELMHFGPMAFTIDLQAALVTYPGGIYIPNFNALVLGQQSLKLIGWNEEESTPYWLARNSWGSKWGYDGVVRIAMYLPGGEVTLKSVAAPRLKDIDWQKRQ